MGELADNAVSVRNLAKQFRLGESERYWTLRETLAGLFRRPKREANRGTFFALRDVSFDIKRGEVVGIIGHNGAGKSTLLKILSRITEPTEGRVDLFGRVSSLLEVGTGFHGELTGRENIYLNGSILGMRHSEINRKFDEIVDFSGVETFLDMPMKHYSSGMQVRLAFAVAAHLEPEILIIDEVLAVGDAEFQRKCLGKMNDVARSGRTVLFVSHNMAAVENLCSRGIVLTHGALDYVGSAHEAVQHYRQQIGNERNTETEGAKYLGYCRFRSCDNGSGVAVMGGKTELAIAFESPAPTKRPKVGVVLIRSTTREPVFGVNTEMLGRSHVESLADHFECKFLFDRLDLMPGEYIVDVWLGSDGRNFEVVKSAAALQIVEADIYGTGRIPHAHTGPVFMRPNVRIEVVPAG